MQVPLNHNALIYNIYCCSLNNTIYHDRTKRGLYILSHLGVSQSGFLTNSLGNIYILGRTN